MQIRTSLTSQMSQDEKTVAPAKRGSGGGSAAPEGPPLWNPPASTAGGQAAGTPTSLGRGRGSRPGAGGTAKLPGPGPTSRHQEGPVVALVSSPPYSTCPISGLLSLGGESRGMGDGQAVRRAWRGALPGERTPGVENGPGPQVSSNRTDPMLQDPFQG